MYSTFFKTKDNEVCDRRNNFVNHPSRCNTFCIILSPPKNCAFLSDENHLVIQVKEDKKWTKCEPIKVKNFLICPRIATGNHEKFKILCSVTTILLPAPQTLAPHTNTKKQTQPLITNKPPVTPRNCSYAVAQGISKFVTNNACYKLIESIRDVL